MGLHLRKISFGRHLFKTFWQHRLTSLHTHVSERKGVSFKHGLGFRLKKMNKNKESQEIQMASNNMLLKGILPLTKTYLKTFDLTCDTC